MPSWQNWYVNNGSFTTSASINLDCSALSVFENELETIKPIIKHEMENAFTMAVPLDVEMGIGENWLEAH